MRRRRNPTIAVDYSLGRLHINNHNNQHRKHEEEEEIEGVIRVYKNGHVERPLLIPSVTCALPPLFPVTSTDVIIDKCTNTWARCYVPNFDFNNKVPVIVYFHGGGFCVGAASWSCYHEFLAKLAGKVNCVIISVNYRLAPENRLPAAYDDGVNAIVWLRKLAMSMGGANKEIYFWSNKCDFSRIFLSGDSAGANIAYNVSIRVCPKSGEQQEYKPITLSPSGIKGSILIQPFFGGESRTRSEACTAAAQSPLTLAASDAYWRLALPAGANRDHPWCNPAGKGSTSVKELRVPPSIVFISEEDILKDRSLEVCGGLSRAGKKVEVYMCKGVGHAFHILSKTHIAQTRTEEMINQIKKFTAT